MGTLVTDLGRLGTPTLGGIIGLFVLALLAGRLLPLATHLRELAAERQRSDDWKAAYEKADERADLLLDQQGRLVEHAQYMRAQQDLLVEQTRRAEEALEQLITDRQRRSVR